MKLENSLKKAVLLLSALMVFIISNAQITIRLEEAIDSALHNNINFLANNLEIDYAKKMQKTNPDFDKTFLDFGFGQINGFQMIIVLALLKLFIFQMYIKSKLLLILLLFN